MNTKNSRNILCGLVIASLSLSSLPAFAQPGQRHDARQDARHDKREARHDVRDAKRDLREARQDRREARQDMREARRYYNARGPEFRRGHRLPPEFRNRTYVVSDWRRHHLNAPPRGYQWVQVGPDYVLAAIATGLIANLILNQ
jgi:Ni/Co efflux regulator RcnB